MVITEEFRKSNSLQPTPRDPNKPDGLNASLSRDREETLRWVEEAPLRLVAAALVDTNRKGRTTALRETLTPEIIPTGDWKGWWKRVQNAVKESPQFTYNPTGGKIGLRAWPSDIEPVRLSELPLPEKKAKAAKPHVDPAIRQAEWFLWIVGDGPDTAPADKPPPALAPFLQGLSAAHTDAAIKRLVNEIERRLVSTGRTLGQATRRNWLAPLAVALKRWTDLDETTTDLPAPTLFMITTIAASNVDLANQAEHDGVVEWLAAYASKNDRNVGLVIDALQIAAQKMKSDVDGLLAGMRDALEPHARIELWRQLVMSNLNQALRPTAQRWLGLLGPEERAEVMSSVVVTARDDDSIQEIDAILRQEWNRAGPDDRHRLFDAIALSWILHGGRMPDSKAAVIEAAEDSDTDDHGFDQSRMSEWRSIVQDAAQSEIDRVREDKDRQTGDLGHQLKETAADLERAKKYAGFLQGENRKKKTDAELEISRDAITVLGIALQGLATSTVPKSQDVSDVEARITLALSTLGAKPVGDMGTTVPFNPSLHEAHLPPAIGTPVKITAPGLVYTRRAESALYLVRIQVQVEK